MYKTVNHNHFDNLSSIVDIWLEPPLCNSHQAIHPGISSFLKVWYAHWASPEPGASLHLLSGYPSHQETHSKVVRKTSMSLSVVRFWADTVGWDGLGWVGLGWVGSGRGTAAAVASRLSLISSAVIVWRPWEISCVTWAWWRLAFRNCWIIVVQVTPASLPTFSVWILHQVSSANLGEEHWYKETACTVHKNREFYWTEDNWMELKACTTVR